MALKFTGEHTQKVDGKGRMSVPADFRRVLEAGDPDWAAGLPMKCQVVYGDHLEARLQVYSVTEYDKVMARIEAMPDADPNKDHITHLMITQSEPLTVDKDGRAVLPLKRREKLGLTEGMLSFRGRLSHFEIWKEEDYDAEVSAPVKDFLSDKPKNFNPLSMVP